MGSIRTGSMPRVNDSILKTGAILALAIVGLARCGGREAAPPASRPRAGPSPLAVRFTDVTREAGITFVHNSGATGRRYLPETMGSGVVFFDYDGDGRQDLFFVNGADWPDQRRGKTTQALYRNRGDGTFEDVTARAGLAFELYGVGAAAADYDN